MDGPVQLFITCILDTLYPQIGESALRVLRRVGCQVEFPGDQTCCGQPGFNAGLRQTALPLAKHTIQVLEKTHGPVVIPSGSCAAMIRHGYLELFSGDEQWLERARVLAARTYEFSEFLVDVLGIRDVGARFPAKIAYHASCHLLRELGVDRQPRMLLEAVRQSTACRTAGRRGMLRFRRRLLRRAPGNFYGHAAAQAGEHRTQRGGGDRLLRRRLPDKYKRRVSSGRGKLHV